MLLFRRPQLMLKIDGGDLTEFLVIPPLHKICITNNYDCQMGLFIMLHVVQLCP